MPRHYFDFFLFELLQFLPKNKESNLKKQGNVYFVATACFMPFTVRDWHFPSSNTSIVSTPSSTVLQKEKLPNFDKATLKRIKRSNFWEKATYFLVVTFLPSTTFVDVDVVRTLAAFPGSPDEKLVVEKNPLKKKCDKCVIRKFDRFCIRCNELAKQQRCLVVKWELCKVTQNRTASVLRRFTITDYIRTIAELCCERIEI